MSCSALLNKYLESPGLFQLRDRLSFSQPGQIFLSHLHGSASQFVAASLFIDPSSSQLNHVFICNDEEDAAYFHNSFENLTQALNIYYFPSSFKNRKNFRL